MVLALQNYEYSYLNGKGKPVYVPTKRTRKLGNEIQQLVHEVVDFDPHFYHLTNGAHVAALHAHRQHNYFARLDLKNFFYSISRNRVKAALKSIGAPKAEGLARWSCVRNPYEEPRYSLPYGFPQSPILATLVLKLSPVGRVLAALPEAVRPSVYLDDIALSSNDQAALAEAFDLVRDSVEAGNFTLNVDKIRPPALQIDLFNCDLSHGVSTVSTARVDKFYDLPRSLNATIAFESYRDSVATGNI